MNKQAARKKALEGKLSIGDLRQMIQAARGSDGISAVNAAIPKERALDIYEAAIATRDDAEVPTVLRPDIYSNLGRMKATRDALIITNILRDCA